MVLRGGLTEAGGKAAASHTGAMAGSAAVYEAAARQTGLVTCTSVQEALDLTTALANLPLPHGRRIAVVTNGGGAGVLAADEVGRQELTLVQPPPDLLAELDEILPPFWSRRNPFDMVATAGGDVGPRVVAAVARCPEVDAVIVLSVLGVPNTGDEVRAQSSAGDYDDFSPWERDYLDGVAALMEETGKPIINVPDLPIRRAVYDGDRPYSPIVAAHPARRGVRDRPDGALRGLACPPRSRLSTEGRRMTPPDAAAAQTRDRRPRARDPVRQRGDRPRRLGGGRHLRLRLPRHSQHGDHGGARQVRRRVSPSGRPTRRSPSRRPRARRSPAPAPSRR